MNGLRISRARYEILVVLIFATFPPLAVITVSSFTFSFNSFLLTLPSMVNALHRPPTY
jgi:nitrate reductase NapE component